MITQLEHDCMSVFEKVFPVSVREEIVSLMKEAYRTRYRWMNESDDFLESKIGAKDLPAHLLRAAIENTARSYCNNGRLPFKFSVIGNSAKNCHHVELVLNDYKIYFVRAAFETEKPGIGIKQALYRPVVEMDLFNPNESTSFHPSTFFITYGDYCTDSLKFVNIGIPGTNSWLFLKHLSLESTFIKPVVPDKEDQILVTLVNEDGAINEKAK